MQDLRSLYLQELEEILLEYKEKPFRAKQVFAWLHKQHVSSFDQMTNLPGELRRKLSEQYTIAALREVDVLTSQIDGTKKYLFELPDGNVIESVRMEYHHGCSVCISSQVGCAMGCRFCASTIGGKVRNLSASEMLGQIYRIEELGGERVSNVVVMGSGEPLDNYEELLRFIRLISHPQGSNISQRNITVSTCGLTDKMRMLAQEKLQITLALSLHAPTQEKRRELMPIAGRYELPEVMDACRDYFEQTGRRITFEYSLVQGKNDTPEDASQLAALIGGMNCHVNLIPVNPVRERSFRRPDRSAVLAFQKKLEKKGINVTIRREMGSDISGACGQLRRSYLNAAGEPGTM